MNSLARKRKKLLSTTAKCCNAARNFSNWLTSDVHIPDSHDYIHMLQNCWTKNTLKQIHAHIIFSGYQQNPFVNTRLIGKYIDLPVAGMVDARKVFDLLSERDIFLWNMMIQGYAKHGPFQDALSCFVQMKINGVSVNRFTFTFMLKACGEAKETKMGEVVHGHVVKFGCASNVFVGNPLVSFYGKCNDVSSSRKVFDDLVEKDIVTWNSMISAYVANGLPNDALDLFRVMLSEGIIAPDRATLVGILPACAQLSALKEGLWIHSWIVKSCMEIDAALGSGLISFYANHGRLKSANLIFDRVMDKNIVVWNAIIRAYGTHGHADIALKLFSQLIDSELCPDGLIFLCLLSACSHAGMISEGLHLFEKMEQYSVEKNHAHYACLIDLYSRAGLLEKAVEIIRTMPIEAREDAYGALLGACRIHKNIELAEEVAGKLFELDPQNSGRYLILIKMYEDSGRYQAAARLRTMMRDKKIKRQVGYSAVEVDYTLHKFGAEEETHPSTKQIFDTLHKLEMVMEDDQITIDPFEVNLEVIGVEAAYRCKS